MSCITQNLIVIGWFQLQIDRDEYGVNSDVIRELVSAELLLIQNHQFTTVLGEELLHEAAAPAVGGARFQDSTPPAVRSCTAPRPDARPGGGALNTRVGAVVQ